jgi:hypothetical protein
MLKQGGVGFVGATKVAYGKHAWSHPYSGSSQSLDYFFTTCCTSNDFTQGEALQWSLTEMYTHNLWYYDKYETFEWAALWGNPGIRMGLINKAPDIPTVPTGPSNGINRVDYSFITVSQDPDQEDLCYQFDWGDGNLSGWYGPLPSGQQIEATKAWRDPGIYNVTARARDEVGGVSAWSEPLAVTIIEGPILDVGLITGGLLRIKSNIWNRGEAEAAEVTYHISLDGGTILMGKETTGTITAIPGGEPIEIQSNPIIGFGKTRVTVFAEIPRCSDIREQGATTFLFFIKVNLGGG